MTNTNKNVRSWKLNSYWSGDTYYIAFMPRTPLKTIYKYGYKTAISMGMKCSDVMLERNGSGILFIYLSPIDY